LVLTSALHFLGDRTLSGFAVIFLHYFWVQVLFSLVFLKCLIFYITLSK